MPSQPTYKSLIKGQWLKPFQQMLSVLAFSSCMEKSTMSEEDLKLNMVTSYTELCDLFLKGSMSGEECRLSKLFDADNKFDATVFPKFGGMRLSLYDRDLLLTKTASTKAKVDGKSLLDMAHRTLKKMKIYLALWTNFLNADGEFHSGKNEEDALKHVLENSDDDDKEDDDDDQGEEEYPSPMYAFIICGPYFFKRFEFPICTCLKTVEGGGSRKEARHELQTDTSTIRSGNNDRGIPSLDSQKLACALDLNRITANQQVLDAIQTDINNNKMLWEMAPDLSTKEALFNDMKALVFKKRVLTESIENENDATKKNRHLDVMSTPIAQMSSRQAITSSSTPTPPSS